VVHGDLLLPEGYVSGSSIEGTTTWANQTFSSIGLTPGTYLYTWGAGADADSLTMEIVAPEPAFGTICGVLVAAMALVWHRKRGLCKTSHGLARLTCVEI
jgi:predicted alpha/beta-hydrolase family hydrolase